MNETWMLVRETRIMWNKSLKMIITIKGKDDYESITFCDNEI